MSEAVESVVLFGFVGLPLVGSFLFLFKVFASRILEIRFSQNEARRALLAKILLLLFFMILNLWLLTFLTIWCFFPEVGPQIPAPLLLVAVFGFLLYWGGIAGLALGLGKVVGAGYGSSARIYRELFHMISESVRGKRGRSEIKPTHLKKHENDVSP